VTPILRLFDGRRSIADVIEDSPTRMAETLRIVKNLLALEVIAKAGTGAPARRPRAPSPRPAAAAADWGALAHAPPALDFYAPVVPATVATGEIDVASGSTGTADGKHNGKKRSRPIEVPVPAHEEDALELPDRTEPMPPPVALSEEERRPRPPAPKTASGEISVPQVPLREIAPAPPVEVSADLPVTVLSVPQSLLETAPSDVRAARAEAAVRPARFEDHEEAFFEQETHFEAAEEHPPESFADLDDGHAPRPSLWKRLLRKLAPGD
jgi:hypothetical protein